MFWDLFGEQGHPIRATISEMGPLLLSRLHGPQRGAGGRAQHRLPGRRRRGAAAARPEGSARDARLHRRARAELTTKYGNVSKPTVGTIQRQLLVLENQGGDKFFGEPALALKDFMQHRPRRARRRQCPGGRQADGKSAALRDVPAVAVVGAVRGAARGRRPPTSPSSCSSSTRRICCSTRRPRRCSTRSSRWCG